MLKKYLIFVFLCFVFIGCQSEQKENNTSQSQNIIRLKSQGLLDGAPYVEFKTGVLSSKDKSINEISAKINDATEQVKIIFDNNTLYLFPKLNANTAYKMSFNFAGEDINLDFKTAFANLDLNNADFNTKNNETFFSADISLSPFYDESLLSKALKLTKSGKTLNFKIEKQNNSYHLRSDTFALNDETEELKLSVDKDILALKENLSFKFQSPAKKEFVFISANPADKLINIKFSDELDGKQNFNDFITLNPDLKFKAWATGRTLKISANFSSNSTYTLSIAKGLKSVNGNVLKESVNNINVNFKDLEPAVSFAQDGTFLASSQGRKIYIKTRNIKKVRAVVSQVFVNNISEYLRYKNIIWSKNDASDKVFSAADSFYYVGKEVLSKDIYIQEDKNSWVQTAIDLSELKDLSGIFVIKLYINQDDLDYNFEDSDKKWDFLDKSQISKNLIFSNIALSAQKINNKLIVNARDYTTNEALRSLHIELVDNTNQIFQSATSDLNGDVSFTLNEDNRLLYIIASDSKQASILKLSNPLSTDGYDVAGLQESGAIKAFIYTDRGVYRPGDDIHLSIVVREDKKSLEHPIYLRFTNPQNQVLINDETLNSVGDGVYYKKLSTDKNDINGIYHLSLNIGGQYFSQDILVQSVVPNRIKVELSADDNFGKYLDYNISSKYLFGAAAANLNYKINAYFYTHTYKNSKYPSYIFKNPSLLNLKDESDDEGNLNEQGKVSSSLVLPEKILNSQGYNFDVQLVSEVFESGGRSVKSVKNVNLNKYKYFVGVKSLENDYVAEGSKLSFDVIVSDLKDNLLKGKKLEYKIYQNDYSWWWDYDSYDEFLRSIKQDRNSIIVESGELVSSDKPVKIEFDTKSYYGNMFIEISDKESGVSTGENFYVSSWGEPNNADIVSSLKIKSDKQNYQIGEDAKLEFESVAGAKALVTLSNNVGIIERFVIDTKDKSTSVDIPIKKEYTPNIYVSVSLFQDYQKLDNDRALRLFGVVPLKVEDPSTKLDLELKAPDKILPNSDFKVEIQSKDKKAYTYTIAIVDEGLLDLSDFKTPDIWGYFYAKMGFNLKTYDTYSQIIPKFTGGDMERAKRANKNRDDEAQRFKPVVLFNAPVKSDEQGYAKLSFKMPSYMGSVRVMVIASSQNSFASAEKNIQVSAPVVMLQTLPRTLRIGDNFTLLTQIFKTQKEVKNATLNIKSQKGLISFNKTSQNVEFGTSMSKDIAIEANVSNSNIGMDTLEFELKTKDYTYKDEVQIDIKALNPYTYENNMSLVKAGESKEFDIDKGYVLGTTNASIKVSATPILDIEKRLKYLLNYPYGCIEQTTSAVLPQLFIDKFSMNFDKQKAINNINAAIERYAKFQTADGGFSYWPGDKESNWYGSNYAGMFLVLAKQNGYYVPQSLYERWLKYEQEFVKRSFDDNNYGLKMQANSLYLLALAKEPNLSAMNFLYERIDKLSNEAKWQLAAAYSLSGMSDIAKKIADSTPLVANSRYYDIDYGSTIRDNAIMANAYKQVYGKTNEDLIKNISDVLLSNDYLSTQSTGYALYALSMGINLKDEAQNNYIDADLKINEQDYNLNQNSPQNFDFKEGKAVLKAKKDTYVSFGVEGVRLKENPPFANKIKLSRSFYDEKGNAIDETKLKSGQTFYMKISVSLNENANSVSNVALTQILPSGWEVSNTILDKNARSFARNSPYDFIDVRDDKIMWFFPLYRYNDATRSFYVKLNAITPGSYTLSGAYAEAMYDDTYKALSSSEKVIVER